MKCRWSGVRELVKGNNIVKVECDIFEISREPQTFAVERLHDMYKIYYWRTLCLAKETVKGLQINDGYFELGPMFRLVLTYCDDIQFHN